MVEMAQVSGNTAIGQSAQALGGSSFSVGARSPSDHRALFCGRGPRLIRY